MDITKNTDNTRMVEIFSGTLWESQMVQSLLESASIISFLVNNIVKSYAFDPGFSGGVKVMISCDDEKEAKVIVDGYISNSDESAVP